MESLDLLQKSLLALYPIEEHEWAAFAEVWQPFSAKRKEPLTLAGDTEKYLYFVLEGVQRVYYFDEQNREATLIFTYAPSFGGIIDSMLMQLPSQHYYETLTPSSFLRAPFAALQPLLLRLPNLGYAFLKASTIALSGVLTRLVELQCFSAEERFRQLLQRSPHILQLVAHKYLANYLGIDATNFSKLINKVRI